MEKLTEIKVPANVAAKIIVLSMHLRREAVARCIRHADAFVSLGALMNMYLTDDSSVNLSKVKQYVFRTSLATDLTSNDQWEFNWPSKAGDVRFGIKNGELYRILRHTSERSTTCYYDLKTLKFKRVMVDDKLEEEYIYPDLPEKYDFLDFPAIKRSNGAYSEESFFLVSQNEKQTRLRSLSGVEVIIGEKDDLIKVDIIRNNEIVSRWYDQQGRIKSELRPGVHLEHSYIDGGFRFESNVIHFGVPVIQHHTHSVPVVDEDTNEIQLVTTEVNNEPSLTYYF